MEFTSGGTNKRKLDYENFNISEGVNICAIIFSNTTKLSLARLFEKLNWSVRMSSSVDFEVECEWAQLEIYGIQEIIIDGGIDEGKFYSLNSLFEKFNLKYTSELYDSANIVIKKASNNN